MSERVIVVGGGLVGLCCAVALQRRGAECVLISDIRAGEASPAAAGMLAPGVEAAPGAAHDFGIAARDGYPAFLEWLQAAGGTEVALDRGGILQLAATQEEAERLQREAKGGSTWLTTADLRKVEPTVDAALGALWHRPDGAVDNEALVGALRRFAARAPRITVVEDSATSVETGIGGVTIRCASGRQHDGSAAIIALGAWTRGLEGIRSLPVEPVRGQMLELGASPLSHVVFGGGGYLVPRRGGSTLVGSTMERVGFDTGTTAEGRSHLLGVASTVSAALGAAGVVRHWAGLRPLTPDLQPAVGRDPERPRVIYACGHSRNGILMAPLTGECVAALAAGEEPAFDLAPFAPGRFAEV